MWYYYLIAAAVVLLALYFGISAYIAVKLLNHLTNKTGRTYEESRQFQVDAEHWDFNDFDNVWDKHEFSVTTFDNLKLYGIYITNPASVAPKKVAIISHGHTANLMQSVKYADIFYKRGYNIVLYDQRFFGKSEGVFSTLGQNETRDLEVIIDKTKEIFGADAFIALHGESMGAASVLSVLKSRENDIKFVVADCPFADSWTFCREAAHANSHLPSRLAVVMANFLAKRNFDYNLRTCSPIKVVKNARLPILYIHGTADTLIVPRHSMQLYAATKNEHSELHLFDGALHARSHMKDAALYQKTMGDFIDKMDAMLYTAK
jgi:fermentation-respiration switch protein FrsA (DUF1100 family)